MEKYSKENLEIIIKNNDNIKDCLIQLSRGTTGDNYNFLNRYIKKYKLDTSHFLSKQELQKRALKKRGGSFRNEIPPEKTFINSDVYRGGADLRKKLLKYSLKEYKCVLCGQDENWITGKITLILDHINGNNTDNRLSNLRFVCPNCDTTLSTYKGKNKKSFKEKQKKLNKKLNKKKQKLKDIENLLLKSNIDFTKKTWGVEVAKVLKKSPQYSLKFIKEKIPSLLN